MASLVRSPMVVGLIAIAGVLGGFAIARRGNGPDVAAAASASAAGAHMRAAIQRVIDEEVTNLETEAQVDAYLSKLEARAIANGRVTALEVEPGFAAIARLRDGDPKRLDQKHQAFASRMSALARKQQSQPTE